MNKELDVTREDQVRRGRKLEYFTIFYKSLEGLISIIAGLIAGSVSLIGFGIEMTSGAALLWRLKHELNPEQRETAERATLRMVGFCFIALAIYARSVGREVDITPASPRLILADPGRSPNRAQTISPLIPTIGSSATACCWLRVFASVTWVPRSRVRGDLPLTAGLVAAMRLQ